MLWTVMRTSTFDLCRLTFLFLSNPIICVFVGGMDKMLISADFEGSLMRTRRSGMQELLQPAQLMAM